MAKLPAVLALTLLACSGSPSEAAFEGPSIARGGSLPLAPPAQDQAASGEQDQADAGSAGTPVASLAGVGGVSAQGGGSNAAGEAPSALAGAGGEGGAPVEAPQPAPIPEGAIVMQGQDQTWKVARHSCWRFTAESANALFTMPVGSEVEHVGCVATGQGMVMNPTETNYTVTGRAPAGTWVLGQGDAYEGCSLACPAP